MSVCFAAKHDCYALVWSYGEICVHCGCCSHDPLTGAKARLEYHKALLEDAKNFDAWAYDYPELMELQKRNIESDLRYHEEKVMEYEEIVERLSEVQKHD